MCASDVYIVYVYIIYTIWMHLFTLWVDAVQIVTFMLYTQKRWRSLLIFGALLYFYTSQRGTINGTYRAKQYMRSVCVWKQFHIVFFF